MRPRSFGAAVQMTTVLPPWTAQAATSCMCHQPWSSWDYAAGFESEPVCLKWSKYICGTCSDVSWVDVDIASINGISKEGPAVCEKYHTTDTSPGSGKREELIWAGGWRTERTTSRSWSGSKEGSKKSKYRKLLWKRDWNVGWDMGKQKTNRREKVRKEMEVRLDKGEGVVQDVWGKRSNSWSKYPKVEWWEGRRKREKERERRQRGVE